MGAARMTTSPAESSGDVVLYQGADGSTKLEVRLENETVWLSQGQMADLFQTSKQNVSAHIANVFDEGELEAEPVVKDFLTTAADGKNYRVKHYNLDVIISVGYRVKSLRGTQFRRVDYDPDTPESTVFFKVVQNKLHYAAHGHTAAEVIAARADADQPFMGLTTFAGEQPTRREVGIAKNYLIETELATLGRMVSAFFDLAELRAMRREPMYMKDWIAELDDFAERYGEGVLQDAGSISNATAVGRAEAEFDLYRRRTLDEPSTVERDYLGSLKQTEKQVARKAKPDEGSDAR